METLHKLSEALQNIALSPIMEGLDDDNCCKLDFSPNNERLNAIDVADTEVFEKYVWEELAAKQVKFGVGGYGEWREIYRRSSLFDGSTAPRNTHLGVDIWAPAGLTVHTPIAGRVHSFQNNAGFGNYGGTVILEHQIAGMDFYTLYGHLGLEFMGSLAEGQAVEAGEQIGNLGQIEENGHWPPHLHFQLMLSMEGHKGDFPGVCSSDEKEHYLSICADPNLLIRLDTLR